MFNFSFTFIFLRGKSLISEGIEKVTRPSITSEELLRQVNLTAEALRKPKKMWTESESSDLDGKVSAVTLIRNSNVFLNYSINYTY